MPYKLIIRGFAISLLLVALAACTVRFAPEHDPALEQGLVSVYEEFQSYFERVEGGDGSFVANDSFYSSTTAKLKVLKLRADTRPAPPGVSSWFSFFGKQDAEKEVQESAAAPPDLTGQNIADIIEILGLFRSTHKSQGTLSPAFISGQREIIESSFKSALLYERILKRD